MAMAVESLSAEEIGRRGEKMYERHIRPHVEPGNAGRYVVLDVDTGAYAVGDDLLELARRMRETHPAAELYSVHIGSDHTARIGISTEPAR